VDLGSWCFLTSPLTGPVVTSRASTTIRSSRSASATRGVNQLIRGHARNNNASPRAVAEAIVALGFTSEPGGRPSRSGRIPHHTQLVHTTRLSVPGSISNVLTWLRHGCSFLRTRRGPASTTRSPLRPSGAASWPSANRGPQRPRGPNYGFGCLSGVTYVTSPPSQTLMALADSRAAPDPGRPRPSFRDQ
jgi:hypothetical protein